MNNNKKYKFNHILFILIFLAGFLYKYNYLLLEIFYVPSLIGVILKNIVIILFLYLIIPYILIFKKGYLSLMMFSLFFTIFFLANYWYHGYYGNYLSIVDMGRGGELLPIIEIMYRQIIKIKDVLYVIDVFGLFVLYPLLKDGQHKLGYFFYSYNVNVPLFWMIIYFMKKEEKTL